MASQIIDDFGFYDELGRNNSYLIYFDPDTEVFSVSFSGTGGAVEQGGVSTSQRGRPVNSDLPNQLVNSAGTIRYYFKSKNSTPFAYVSIEQEIVPCDIDLDSSSTDETADDANDGTITLSATSQYTGIEYSINGTDWFSSGLFTGLAPGLYTGSARDSNECIATAFLEIKAYVDPDTNVKYRVDYRDNFDNPCRIDVLQPGYEGPIIPLRGVGKSACIITRDCGDDPYETIVNSKAEISVYQEENLPIDILELQNGQDREFKVNFYISGNIEFTGFIIPDGIQQYFKAAPFELNFTATDGLKLLSDIPYSHTELTGGRSIINYFRQILFANLGLPLPIRWANTLKNEAFLLEDDLFSGSVRWAANDEGFKDSQGKFKSGLYILEGMLKSMQCRIVQSGGRWVIWRINDVVTGQFNAKETPATLSGLSVVDVGALDVNKSIWLDGDYRLIMNDTIITSLPGLKSVKTTYQQDQRDNILPNGNMDILGVGVGTPPVWWTATNVTSFQSAPSLSDAKGYSARIFNSTGGAGEFGLTDIYLPIDSDVLYDHFNFGFKFSIVSGYTLDGDGNIDWALTPFKFQISYLSGSVTYFLNEFGFWVTTATSIQITVDNLRPNDIAQVDFNRRQNIPLPLPDASPLERETPPSLQVTFEIPDGRTVVYDDIYLNVESNSDVYEAQTATSLNTGSEDYTLEISSAHSGFYVSNFMRSFSQSGLDKFFRDSRLEAATLTEMNSHAILRNRYKNSLMFEGSIYGGQYKYDEIYNIPTYEGKKFLPLRSAWNTETNAVSLTMVEVRDDGTGITLTHYGSNDNTANSN